MLTLYDAPRCPYCARTRIVLAEKGIDHETVVIDLDDRPRSIVELNPPAGRVPVLEDGGLVLPESEVIDEYLDERVPQPPLMPADAAGRARVRFLIQRFDELGDPYYDLLAGRPSGSHERLADALAALGARLGEHQHLAGDAYSLADIAYVPWLLRAERRLAHDVRADPRVGAWLDRLLARPAVAAERALVESLW
jgi:RNA polymerase-associated protein